MLKFITFFSLLSVPIISQAENMILIKPGLTMTYPKDDWSQTVSPRFRLAVEYRKIVLSENFFQPLIGLEAGYQKLAVDNFSRDVNEFNWSTKIGLCIGTTYKICPLVGYTYQYIQGSGIDTNFGVLNTSIGVLEGQTFIRGIEITKRFDTYRSKDLKPITWSKIDINLLLGIKY